MSIQKKELEAIITRASFVEVGDNAATEGNTKSNDISNNTENNAENGDVAGRNDGNNTARAGKKAIAFGGATTKNATAKNAATRMDNIAKNIEGRQNKDGESEKKKQKCRYLAIVEETC